MTIEFHCPHCDRLLKTPDDKAGVRANCPGCGQMLTVPDPVHEAAQPDTSFAPPNAAGTPPPHGGAPDADEHEIDEQEIIETGGRESGSQHDLKPCPMCGAAIKISATRCRFCGETIVRRAQPGAWEPTRIDAGDVLNVAWETFKDQFGILIGAFLITLGISIGLAIIQQAVQGVVAFALIGAGGGGGGGGNPLAALFAIMGVSLVFAFISIAVQIYIEAGFTLVLLRVARGERVEIAEIFSGARFFWRLLGLVFLLFVLAVVAYFIVLVPVLVMRDPIWIVAGMIPIFIISVFLALRFWPVIYVIVDRDAGIIDALQDSYRATTSNSLAVIVLALAAVGVYLLGLLACLIGVLVAFPFIRLFFTVAYCGMTGQIALRRE